MESFRHCAYRKNLTRPHWPLHLPGRCDEQNLSFETSAISCTSVAGPEYFSRGGGVAIDDRKGERRALYDILRTFEMLADQGGLLADAMIEDLAAK